MPPLSQTKGTDQNRVAPSGSWDCHHHIFDLSPAKLAFPLADSRHFTPRSAPLCDFEEWAHKIGVDHSGLTHGLSFGEDLSSLIYYLEYWEGSGRAFAVINLQTVTDEDMWNFHQKGVRGIRIDYHYHNAQHDVRKQADLMRLYAARIAPLGWKLQVYHPHPEFWNELLPVVEELPVQVVLDHFGALKTQSLLEHVFGEQQPDFEVGEQAGLKAICELLKTGKLWIKLSAPYRCSNVYPHFDDLESLVKILVTANSDRVLYGSDWPHTQPFHKRPPNLKGTDIEEFLNIDDHGWLRNLKKWTTNEEWMKLMVQNPVAFFDYPN